MDLKVLRDAPKVNRVLGVDASTQSLAFCLMVRDKDSWTPERWGKMDIVGQDIYEQCGDVNSKLYGLMKLLDPDHVAVEAVIHVNNRGVVIKLAKIVGAMIGVTMATGRPTTEVTPIAWMNYIGNQTRDSADTKRDLAKQYPGKSKNWYKAELRKQRKQRTAQWVEDKFGPAIDDDDVTDAFGVAWYACNEHID